MKKTKLFNLFDLVAIALIVVLAAVFLLLRGLDAQTGEDDSLEPNSTVRYTVEFTNLRHGMAERFTVGEELFTQGAGMSLGTIEEVRVEPTVAVLADTEQGVYRVEASQLNETAFVTLVAECVETDQAIRVSNALNIRIGGGVYAETPEYLASGTIIGIER